MLGLILNFLGGSVLGKLQEAYHDYLNAQNDEEKRIHEERIEVLKGQLTVAQNATSVRLATAGFWEMRFLAFLTGITAVAHYALIGVGTTFAAPLGWHFLDWTLHIPPFPAPFDDYEGLIILSFFGLVGVTNAAKSIAGAVALRGLR